MSILNDTEIENSSGLAIITQTTFNACKLVAKAQDLHSRQELIKWLDEPCEDHYDEKLDYDITTHTNIGGYHKHRKDCPLCWAKILDGSHRIDEYEREILRIQDIHSSRVVHNVM